MPVIYDVFSMGMFILDEIHTADQEWHDVVGGAGTYAALGAALFRSVNDRKRVGFVLDVGNDFPSNVLSQIRSWHMGVVERVNTSRRTTRGWNNFVGNEERQFRYLAPKLQIHASDLLNLAGGNPARSRTIHLICSTERCNKFINELKLSNIANVSPQLMVWEPVPTSCVPEEWNTLKDALPQVDVFSPNALEAAQFLGEKEPKSRPEVELLTSKFTAISSHPQIIIRCGALGAYAPGLGWFPAYHKNGEGVVDPSGAGNSFLGGLCAALSRDPTDWITALAQASVAAGVMIEQVGVPSYDPDTDLWNNTSIFERVQQYILGNNLDERRPVASAQS